MLAVHQQPTDLVLAVTEGALPDAIKVLDSAVVTCADWRFTFRIIGESHAITIQHGDDTHLHEILACVEMPVDVCQHHQPFDTLAAHGYACGAYAIQVSFDATPPWTIPADADGIAVAFPAIHAVTPITQIRWQRQGKSLHWWTLHLYPAPDAVTAVHSRSRFDCV